MPEGVSEDLLQTLSTHAALLDASFAMQPGFARFVSDHAIVLQAHPLLLPKVVLEEVERLTRRPDPELRAKADVALKALEQLVQAGMAQLRHESSDTFADHVIQRVVEQHMLSRDLLVLTNDAPLMRDVRAKLAKESVRTKRSIKVFKLHGRTQRPVEFLPHEPGDPRTARPAAPVPPPTSSTLPPSNSLRPFNIASVATTNETLIPAQGELGTGSVLSDSRGGQFTLGKEIARGGEGTIFEVSGRSSVCKVYDRSRLTRGREQKLELMLTRQVSHPSICWPASSVRDQRGVFRGYLMPRAGGEPLGHGLFLPKQFMQRYPRWTRRDSVQLALTVLDAIEFLHGLGVLVGDLNPQNILVKGPSEISIVDCDSFQVEGFPCPVGTVNFSAPEIQGKNFGEFLRTPDHELFAVATLLFMIFFPGKSPYSHTGGADGAANIREMEFPYTRDVNSRVRKAPAGVWTFCWSHLSKGLKDSFTRSFDRKHLGEPRLSLREWRDMLGIYQRILSDPARVFLGPAPQVGYDLSIMPRSRRFTPERSDKVPKDGRSDYDRLVDEMVKRAAAPPRSAPPPAPKRSTGGQAMGGGTPPLKSSPSRQPTGAAQSTRVPPTAQQSSEPSSLSGLAIGILGVLIAIFVLWYLVAAATGS